MKNEPSIKKEHTLHPEHDFEDPNDASWQISYLDIITIVLGFLIILLSTSLLSEENNFSVSSLFKSSSEEVPYVTTPINQIQKSLELSLLDEIYRDELEIVRDLNDLVIRFKSDDLYLSGSATLKANALPLLNSIIEAIKENRYSDFDIAVEGHTDDVPITSAAYASNWELSTARATNVVKYLTGMGINTDRLKASGFGASKPIVPNRDVQGNAIPKNRSQNRRVDIRLYYTTLDRKNEFVPTVDSEVTSLADGCTFSVQLGGFQSFSNALNKAKEVLNRSDNSVDITHNGRLFSVRTEPQSSFSSNLDDYYKLEDLYPENIIGIIHQCYSSQDMIPKPVEFHIQFGAFQNRVNAENFASRLQTNYRIPVSVSSENGQTYKVHSRSFQSLRNALSRLQQLESEGFTEDKLLVLSEMNTAPYKFNYQIQAGTFNDLEEAQDLSERITSLMGIHTTVHSTDNKTYILVTEQFNDWNQTIRAFSDFIYTSYDLDPAIYLLEHQ